jgi:hypothetical protein
VKARSKNFIAIAAALGGLFLASAMTASTQESAPITPAVSSSNGPLATLRDLLMAACAENQEQFGHFLTERNQVAFNHMSQSARVSFMKRFVLLNEPGKPSSTANPSGRPIVRCDTPAGAAEIQVGGADTHDNVAFMPIQLRDATDNSGATSMQVQIGLVREGGEWKILSLGLVLLDLPSLEIEWDSAEVDKNEQSAIESLKTIAEAVEAYRQKYARLPDALSNLGPGQHGPSSPDFAGLLDSDLAGGARDGYLFRYVIIGASTLGAPAKFALAATPAAYARTGRRSFFRDTSGTLRGADRQGAVGSETDPKLP